MVSSTFICRSSSAIETKAWGARLGSQLKSGQVVVLLANLGSGKTTFVQGLIKSLGIKEEALSPTFIVAQTFKGRSERQKKLTVHHLDFYRLSKKEILEMGVYDYLAGAGEIDKGAVLIEWAERCREIWPPERLEIRIKILPRSTAREISFRGVGKNFIPVIANLKKCKK